MERVRVFPTHVGVFLPRPREFEQILRLPHARGGVSEEMIAIDRKAMSSPRTWGCFRCAVFGDAKIPVFPTHVGVFLVREETPQGSPRLPHARGGVSGLQARASSDLASSPRTWGCFPHLVKAVLL